VIFLTGEDRQLHIKGDGDGVTNSGGDAINEVLKTCIHDGALSNGLEPHTTSE
jgi:hypothetical protein